MTQLERLKLAFAEVPIWAMKYTPDEILTMLATTAITELGPKPFPVPEELKARLEQWLRAYFKAETKQMGHKYGEAAGVKIILATEANAIFKDVVAHYQQIIQEEG